MSLEPLSEKRLAGVHPDLVRVVHRAAEIAPPFRITCGLRTAAEQRVLVATGKSKTLKSRHLTGHAVDYVALHGKEVSWDAADMRPIAEAFKRAGADCGVPIEWGGDWKSFVDMPHIQLPAKDYPPDKTAATIAPAREAEPGHAGPLRTSRTIWGTFAGGLAAVAGYAESSVAAALEWAAKLTELSPVQTALASAGGNTKSIILGVGVWAAVAVIAARVRASTEGKPG